MWRFNNIKFTRNTPSSRLWSTYSLSHYFNIKPIVPQISNQLIKICTFFSLLLDFISA